MSPAKTAEKGTVVSFDPRIVLRPRTLDETIDLALAYIRNYPGDFARMLVLSAIVGFLAIKTARLCGASWGVCWAIALVSAPLLERVVIVYFGHQLFGNEIGLWASLMRAMKRPHLALGSALFIPLPWLPMALTSFDEEVWIGLGIMLVPVWPFVLALSLYFSSVVLLEQPKLKKAFKRSWDLITYRLVRASFFVAASALIRVATVLGVEVSATFVVGFLLQLGEPLDLLSNAGGSYPAVLGYFLAAPVVALARLFDYVDARTRFEGWDIQVRFKAAAKKAREDRGRRLAA